jgi:hypothetical protein
MSAEDRAAVRQAGAGDAPRFRQRQGLPERIEDAAAVPVLAAILRDTPTPATKRKHQAYEETSGMSRVGRRRRSPRLVSAARLRRELNTPAAAE